MFQHLNTKILKINIISESSNIETILHISVPTLEYSNIKLKTLFNNYISKKHILVKHLEYSNI